MASRDAFAALASPIRRDLLRLLLDEPRSVKELAAHFDMQRPSVSEHLRVLREAELVRERREGRHRIYALDPRPLEDVAEWLHPFEQFWRDRLGRLVAILDGSES